MNETDGPGACARLSRRGLLKAAAAGALGVGFPAATSGSEAGGELLYNGIRLPAEWPPRVRELPAVPALPPYLLSPPAVIPIDLGRQLFVDDFLIEKTTLTRVFQAAEYHPKSPVLRPDRPWEQTGRNPTAMVFSDGVWYDPRDRLFKMWYMGGYGSATCYATSEDGLRWEKPALDVVAGTNIVQPDRRDSTTVWLDQVEHERGSGRWELFRSYRMGEGWGLYVYFSKDGIHWGEPALKTGPCGDRTTAFYNPFRKVWVYSLRSDGRRRRRYWEARDLIAGPRWTRSDEPTLWTGATSGDARRADLKTPCELYNLDCVAYESLILGLFTIWRGQPRDRPKPNEVCVGFSRDGFHWFRANSTGLQSATSDRHPAFFGVSEQYGDWNWGNVQSAGGCCLVVGDRLYFYCSGRAGVRGTPESGVSTTGLATLRRDGFAPMIAGEEAGTLTTRPVRFSGKHLFVNVDSVRGELRVDVLDQQGKVIPHFAAADCVPIRADSTRQRLAWRAVRDLSSLARKPVRFRFTLRNGRLYAFWVSPDPSGASDGYVAAGGPGLRGPVDV